MEYKTFPRRPGRKKKKEHFRNSVDHLAGIVPIVGPKLDFRFPWHDCLIPVNKNYLAVEAAVFNCAVAGCDTIWIVADESMNPVLRKRIGPAIIDPYSYRKIDQNKKIKYVPIFYVPVHPKDKKKRNSLGWSTLYGAYMARYVTKFMSRWFRPYRFFVSFPYGMVNPRELGRKRDLIRNPCGF